MEYIRHLSLDARMAAVIRKTGPVRVVRRPDVCLYLCRSIVAQQLSTKVASIIESRLTGLLSASIPTPDAVLSVSKERLRSIGLSATKADYLHNVARYFRDLSLEDAVFRKLDDESVIQLLTEIKGVGRWTAEMTLMFSLGRKDVFSPDDYGIQQAMVRLYDLEGGNRRMFKTEMERIAMAWSPYRTYACLHLWKSKDEA
jgi:DNA-3-methyladenine glycosylase II